VNHPNVSGRWFPAFSRALAILAGRASTFFLAVALVLVWILSGPLFHFSDTWQLVVNTGTTIVTFLMVFLMQNTQNRDTEAIQIKLDELIRATRGARNALIDLEQLDEEELAAMRKRYEELARAAKDHERARHEQRRAARPHAGRRRRGGPLGAA
jgi:low affinity Fe/Cu permease